MFGGRLAMKQLFAVVCDKRADMQHCLRHRRNVWQNLAEKCRISNDG